jgi:dolichyl-phosphate-mannose-protein mannosyltransferase
MIVPRGSGWGPTRFRAALTIALAAAAVGALLLRSVSIAEPLGIDQSLWASAVRGMSRGQLLYRDVWEQRPPGIYWIYLAGFQIFGWTASTVAWLDILASAATTLLIYAIARALSHPTTGAVAAALYAVLTMPAWLYRYGGFLERSVCETFIVVCVGLSFWCAVRFLERESIWFAAGVGLAAGAAIVLKPNAGLYFPAVLLWMVLYRRAPPRPGGGSVVRPIVVAALGAAVIPAICIVWLWWLGILGEARIAVVDFNRFYVAQGFTVGGYALDFSKAVWLRMKTDALWLSGGVGVLVVLWDLARKRRLPPLAGLAVLWGGAAALVIVVNGARLFNSYFIQALAPLSLLAAWLLAVSARGSTPRRTIGAVTAGLMILVLLQRHYPAKVFGSALEDFDLLRGRTPLTEYLGRFGGYDNSRGYSARANYELASYVRERTLPDDRIFIFGINGAGVYFAADRLTAHRFLRANFFVSTDFPDERFRLEAVTAELAAQRPRYIIFERLNSPSDMGKAVDALPGHPAVVRLLDGYRLDVQIEDFTLYRRAD